MERTLFRSLLKFQRPQTKDSEIPHRTKIRATVLELAETVRDCLMEEFKVSLTLLLQLSSVTDL